MDCQIGSSQQTSSRASLTNIIPDFPMNCQLFVYIYHSSKKLGLKNIPNIAQHHKMSILAVSSEAIFWRNMFPLCFWHFARISIRPSSSIKECECTRASMHARSSFEAVPSVFDILHYGFIHAPRSPPILTLCAKCSLIKEFEPLKNIFSPNEAIPSVIVILRQKTSENLQFRFARILKELEG